MEVDEGDAVDADGRRVLEVDDQAWTALQERLRAPRRTKPELLSLLGTPSVLERSR